MNRRARPAGTDCQRCQADATADPCGSCPLYGGYLERFDLPDEPEIRDRYARWARWGGWLLVWTLHSLATRRAARITAMNLMAAYPRVNPEIVMHYLGKR